MARFARFTAAGAVFGLVGGAAMAVFAMAWAVHDGTGFWTPVYHTGSPLLGDGYMKDSMNAASTGSQYTLFAGPALLGLGVHMAWSLAWGVLFACFAYATGLGAITGAAWGAIYGIGVMFFMSYVTLPLTSRFVGGGAAIRHMPQMVGWGPFTAEHLIYGSVLGLLVGLVGRHEIRAEMAAQTRPETLRPAA
jgi:hypothetical protein